MVTIEDIYGYIQMLIPYAKYIVLFIIPYYIIIGEIFANIALSILTVLPDPASAIMVYMIIAGVIGALGLILGIKLDPERRNSN